jgi:hypothetical protein
MTDPCTGILPFVSQIVSSLAWPAIVLTCALLLRRHLAALLPLVRSVKYSDVEIRFGKEVSDLAKSAETSSLPENASIQKQNQWVDIEKLVDARPRTAIRMAFRRLEEGILNVARTKHIEIADGAMGMPMVVGAILLNKGVISSEQYDLLSRLRTLLNEAEIAPPDSIKSESAAEFVSLALRLADSIK